MTCGGGEGRDVGTSVATHGRGVSPATFQLAISLDAINLAG